MQLLARSAQIGVGTGRNLRTLFVLDTALPLRGITAVVGENGAGKTTLLRTIAGFAPTLGGELLINAVEPRTYRQTEGVGFLSEEIALPSTLRGLDILSRVWLAVHGAGIIDAAMLHHALELAGVDFPLANLVGTLSHGMRQRLALAAALLPRPGLLLLDEPETGLDPAQRSRLRSALTRLASQGTAIVVSSHDISGICLCAQQMCLISEGRLQTLAIAEGTTAAQLHSMLPARWRP